MSQPHDQRPLVFTLDADDRIASQMDGDRGRCTVRRFPDGESYVRVESSCAGRDVVLVQTLHEPDGKLLPLYFLAKTVRELGARRVFLVAPYLAYMRQDRRFSSGEGVTARYFAELVSTFIDGLVTVDPHLHRIADLSEVYRVPSRVAHAAPAVAAWIDGNVQVPVLVGPDSESEQWVSEVAALAHAPFVVLSKVRRGDRDVEVSMPHLERFRGHTPVLVDDIISTGRTMLETMGHLERLGLPQAVCVGVHAVFAGDAFGELSSKAARVATTDTIVHPSNALSMGPAVAHALRDLIV